MRLKSISRNIKFIFFYCLSGTISFLAFSDELYLKNGRKIEGIIEKEDEDSVTLNVGVGTIGIKKKDIDRIVRDTPEQRASLKKKWSYKYFLRPEFVPERLKDIANDFRNLEKLRNIALRSKETRDSIMEKLNTLEKELEDLNTEVVRVSRKLSKMNPKENLEEYNALVEEYNSLVAQMEVERGKQRTLKTQVADLNQKISAYTDSLNEFNKKFKNEFYVSKSELMEQEKNFLERIKKEMDSIEKDFTEYRVGYQRLGSHLVVRALLNGVINADLIVDTGASIVVISESIARRLGITVNSKEFSVSVTLADGSHTKAYPIILKSIQVGDVKVSNVRAAVLPRGEPVGIDGLLGMSFLERFVVKIDAKNNRLILEEFNP